MKTISIRDDIYRRLVEIKGEGESFSDVIEKLLEKKVDISEYFGVLKDSETLEEIEKCLELRKRARIRL